MQVIPGRKDLSPLSNMALLQVVKRLGMEGKVTAHGFRSSFKDWATECTPFPHEVSETALSHTVRDKTVAAYRRGDIFEKRRKLMEAWQDFAIPKRKTKRARNISAGNKNVIKKKRQKQG